MKKSISLLLVSVLLLSVGMLSACTAVKREPRRMREVTGTDREYGNTLPVPSNTWTTSGDLYGTTRPGGETNTTTQPVQTAAASTAAPPATTRPAPATTTTTQAPRTTTTQPPQTTVTTTQPPQTTAATPQNRRSVDAFYEMLCSETWVPVTRNEYVSPPKNVEFTRDGNMKLYYYDALYTYKLAVSDLEYNTLFNEDGGFMNVSDLGRDDMFLLTECSEGDCYTVFIRQSAYDRNNSLIQALRMPEFKMWKSPVFADNGVSVLNTDDFDLYPVNRTTALLVYRGTLKDCAVQAVVTVGADGQSLDAYLIVTVPYETELFDDWFAERWVTA